MLLSELPFEPLGTNTPGPATGISIAGVDLAGLYAPASSGTASGVATGFTVAGADIGTLFAAVGSAAKLNNSWASEYSGFEQGSDVVTAIVSLVFKTDGTVETPYGTLRWLAPNLNSADYEIIATPNFGTFTENMMVAYAQLNTNRLLSKAVTAGPSAAFEEESASATITIRNILEPAQLVTGSVLFVVNAASYGSGGPP
jgi:hypothetical protein